MAKEMDNMDITSEDLERMEQEQINGLSSISNILKDFNSHYENFFANEENEEYKEHLNTNKIEKLAIDTNVIQFSGRIVNTYETDKVYILTLSIAVSKDIKNYPKIFFFKRDGIVQGGADRFKKNENVNIKAHVISSVHNNDLTNTIIGDIITPNDTLAVTKYTKHQITSSLNNMLYQYDKNEFVFTGTVVKKNVSKDVYLFMISLNEYGKHDCFIPLCYFHLNQNKAPKEIKTGMRIAVYGRVQTDYKPDTREFFQAFDIKDIGIIS